MSTSEKTAQSKRSRAGKRSAAKGPSFERLIASKLREVYDPPRLVEECQVAAKARQTAVLRELHKRSRVRRSDQGRGAQEPDLVVIGCPCWLELNHANDPRPLAKLAQAERDTIATESPLWPVVVWQKTRSKTINVTMRTWTLWQFGCLPSDQGRLPDEAIGNAVITTDLVAFLAMLRHWEDHYG